MMMEVATPPRAPQVASSTPPFAVLSTPITEVGGLRNTPVTEEKRETLSPRSSLKNSDPFLLIQQRYPEGAPKNLRGGRDEKIALSSAILPSERPTAEPRSVSRSFSQELPSSASATTTCDTYGGGADHSSMILTEEQQHALRDDPDYYRAAPPPVGAQQHYPPPFAPHDQQHYSSTHQDHQQWQQRTSLEWAGSTSGGGPYVLDTASYNKSMAEFRKYWLFSPELYPVEEEEEPSPAKHAFEPTFVEVPTDGGPPVPWAQDLLGAMAVAMRVRARNEDAAERGRIAQLLAGAVLPTSSGAESWTGYIFANREAPAGEAPVAIAATADGGGIPVPVAGDTAAASVPHGLTLPQIGSERGSDVASVPLLGTSESAVVAGLRHGLRSIVGTPFDTISEALGLNPKVGSYGRGHE